MKNHCKIKPIPLCDVMNSLHLEHGCHHVKYGNKSGCKFYDNGVCRSIDAINEAIEQYNKTQLHGVCVCRCDEVKNK